MACTHLFWDWNGTLLDDLDLCVDLLDRMLTARGLPGVDLARYHRIFRFPIKAYYADAGFDFEKEPYEQLAIEYMDHYVPESAACPLRQDAAAALTRAADAGVTQYILSASDAGILKAQVEARGILPLFEKLLGLDNIHGASKVQIARDEMVRAQLDPAACCLIGDTDHDSEVAKAIGCRCVLVEGGHHDRERLEATGCPVAKDLAEALTLAGIEG